MLLLSFVLHIFDVINIYLIICALKKEKFCITKKIVTISGLWVVCGSICAIAVSLHMYKIIIFMNTLFYIYIISSKKIYEIVELFMSLIICLLVFQSITIFIVKILLINNENIESLCGQTLTFIMTLFVYHKIPIHKLFRLLKKNIIARVIISGVFIILFIFTIYIDFDVKSLNEYIIYVFILLVLTALIFWDAVIRMEKEIIQKKELEVYQTYLSSINEVITDVRAIQHEVDNKLTGISSIINASDDAQYIKNEVKKYLGDIIVDTDTKKLLKVEHKIIELFILEKIKKAKDKQIKIESKVIYEKSNTLMEDYKTIQILGILIDNAIEANIEETQIYVSVIINDASICIEVANEHEKINIDQVNKMFKKGYSTKTFDNNRKRGYGLYNLSKIVNQYKGKIIHENQVRNGNNHVVIRIEITE